jgi:hypothetical protein
MNGNRITHALSRDLVTKELFAGIGCPDLPLPQITKTPAVVVLNTDLYRNPGEHWCVMLFENAVDRYFFDSFGHQPSYYGFQDHISLERPKSKCKYNSKVIQHVLSKTCGHHCIYFIYHLGKGYKPNDIVSLYSNSNLRANDYSAFDFVVNRYGTHIAGVL